VIRLWHRIGVFRLLSVGLLILGVVAAGFLSVDRQSHQRVSSAADTTAVDNLQNVAEQQRQLAVANAERERANAASRNAQREAQAKADAAAVEAAASAKAAEDAARKAKPSTAPSAGKSSAPAKPPPPFGPVPTSCNAYTGNKAIGCTLLLESGEGLDQMVCLDKLWTKESGWRVNAANGSGAYGIPQALPGSKMAPYGADWKTNAVPQIKWGLAYVKGKYKNACGAWGNWQSKGWY
jgi:hypothetical protein